MLARIIALTELLKLMNVMNLLATEYCQFEYFNVTCPQQHVILITSALYGRLQTGRCVTKSYGSLGCVSDVLPALDASCSARRRCVVNVATLRDLVRPCPGDLTAYLDASYRCLPVVDLSSFSCNSTLPIADVTSSLQDMDAAVSTSIKSGTFLAGHHGLDDDSGTVAFTSTCPLKISASPGQAINFTLYSFNPSDRNLDRDMMTNSDWAEAYGRRSDGYCPTHLFIIDSEKSHGAPLCPWKWHRERQLYISRSSTVSIYFSRQFRRHSTYSESGGTFLLQIEALGCPDPVISEEWAVERRGSRLNFHCHNSPIAWSAVCVRNRWIGKMKNCSQHPASREWLKSREKKASIKRIDLKYGVSLAVSVGVLLGVLAGGLLLICLYIFKHRKRHRNYLATFASKSQCERRDEDNDSKFYDISLETLPVLHRKDGLDSMINAVCYSTCDYSTSPQGKTIYNQKNSNRVVYKQMMEMKRLQMDTSPSSRQSTPCRSYRAPSIQSSPATLIIHCTPTCERGVCAQTCESSTFSHDHQKAMAEQSLGEDSCGCNLLELAEETQERLIVYTEQEDEDEKTGLSNSYHDGTSGKNDATAKCMQPDIIYGFTGISTL